MSAGHAHGSASKAHVEKGVETFRNADASRCYASMWRAHRAYAEDSPTAACRSIVIKHLGQEVKVPAPLLEWPDR